VRNARLFIAAAAVVVATCYLRAQSPDQPRHLTTAPRLPIKIVASHLPNAYRIHAKVISGGLPEGEAAFQELAALGVKTIISVDGARPDVALAKAHGMRYVHLPHGYDGIPNQRMLDLARAVRDLPGQVYIHCHHGKHRSPTAAAVACVAAGLIDADSAEAILKTAGTGESYRGLYQSARQAQPVAALGARWRRV